MRWEKKKETEGRRKIRGSKGKKGGSIGVSDPHGVGLYRVNASPPRWTSASSACANPLHLGLVPGKAPQPQFKIDQLPEEHHVILSLLASGDDFQVLGQKGFHDARFIDAALAEGS